MKDLDHGNNSNALIIEEVSKQNFKQINQNCNELIWTNLNFEQQ